jgi:antirestriction protein ArdC
MTIEQTTQPAHQRITDAILEKLEQGVVPWRKPWTTLWPQNIAGWQYRGINVLTLALAGFSSPYWLTFNQAKKLGGHVRRGQKSTPVLFWKVYSKDREDEDDGEVVTHRRVFARCWWVFNLEQTCGIRDDKLPAADDTSKFTLIERAAQILDSCQTRR